MKKLLLTAAASLCLVAGVFAQNLPGYVPKDGLVGYWGFDGNANDYSVNGNHGTVNGATLSNDRNGNANSAYTFDGQNDFIEILNSDSIRFLSNKQSLTFWMKVPEYPNPPCCPDIEAVMGKSNNSGGFFVHFAGNGALFYSIASPAANTWGDCPIEKDYYQANEFIFIVFTNDGDSLKAYVNNKLINKIKLPLNTAIGDAPESPLFFGKENNNAHFFNGSLDDIAIYDRALTQEEITALYTSTPVSQNIPSYVPKNGLVGYWPFDGNANDESGNGNNGTVNGATLAADRFGNSNKAFHFDGINDNIGINSMPMTSFSLHSWINITTLNQNNLSAIISNYYYAFYNGFELRIEPNGNILLVCGQTSSHLTLHPKSTNLQTKQWYQLVATSDNNTVKIFLDANLIASAIISNTQNNTPRIFFGTRDSSASNGGYFNGELDDIAIYNRALTQQEITALYNSNSGATITADAPTTAKQNDTLEVAINTTELKTEDGIISYQTDFSFDTTRVSYLSHSLSGSIVNGGNAVVNANKKGELNISYMNAAAITGTGSLIKFKFLANTNIGKAPFVLSNFLYNTSPVNQLVNDTVLITDGVPPTGKISLSANTLRKGDSLLITATFNEKMAASPLPQLSISGANTLANSNMIMVNDTVYTYTHVVEKGEGLATIKLATGTDLAGNTVIENPTLGNTFTLLPTVYGDIDTNKLVQAYDAALALQYSVSLNPIPAIDSLPWSNWRMVVANVDTVGSITANDASLILQHSAKLINAFPADASIRGINNNTAEVNITQEADKLVFRAKGSLFGFNLYVKENFSSLGTPTVSDKNMIVATNINAQNYAIGLATAYAPAEDAVFMTIPLTSNAPSSFKFDMVLNTENVQQSIGNVTSIKLNDARAFSVFPNPTKDVLNINNAVGHTVKIIDFNGKEVFNQLINAAKQEVSMKQLGAKGIYFLSLLDQNNKVISTQKIILE